MANWYDCNRCGKQYKEADNAHECADVLTLRARLALLERVAEAANQYLAYTICRTPKDPNIERKRENELRAALSALTPPDEKGRG